MVSENPWLSLPPVDPYVLPSDAAQIEAFNSNRSTSDLRHLQLDVLPEPFIGRADAPVVLLNVNPGYTPEDVRFTQDAHARERWWQNAGHQASDFPFYPLDPSLAWTATANWWNKRVQPLVAQVGREAVAQALLCIEYFPYHSRRDPRFPGEVPSQAYGFALVEQAIDRGAMILVMRGIRGWRHRVPRLNSFMRVADSKNPQAAFVSQGNFPDIFDDLVAVMKRF